MIERSRRAVLALIAALTIVAVTGCGVPDPPRADLPPPEGGPGAYRLLLDERFDGEILDSSRWGTCHWWAEGDGCTIAGNDELEWYQPHRVSVRDGVLRLEAAEEEIEAPDGTRFAYTSGMVTTGRPGDRPQDRARLAFTYGVVQVSFRAPVGTGLWPAIWMLPASNESRPEIDLLEVYGDELTRPTVTLHHGVDERKRAEARTGDLSQGWHTVELTWTPDLLRWSIDGDEVLLVQGEPVPDEPMYLVMNLAVGGSNGAPTADTVLPAALEVDSVRIWSLR